MKAGPQGDSRLGRLEVKQNQQAPLPGKVAALLRESRLFVLVAAALYLSLVLTTFNRVDPASASSCHAWMPPSARSEPPPVGRRVWRHEHAIC
ncbi:MAG TPA: hypothetical protein VIW78_01485, partial [Burkholderiales bacterium]